MTSSSHQALVKSSAEIWRCWPARSRSTPGRNTPTFHCNEPSLSPSSLQLPRDDFSVSDLHLYSVRTRPPDQGACLVLSLHCSQLPAQFLSSVRRFQHFTCSRIEAKHLVSHGHRWWEEHWVLYLKRWITSRTFVLFHWKCKCYYSPLICSLPRFVFFTGLYRVPPHKEKPVESGTVPSLWTSYINQITRSKQTRFLWNMDPHMYFLRKKR